MLRTLPIVVGTCALSVCLAGAGEARTQTQSPPQPPPPIASGPTDPASPQEHAISVEGCLVGDTLQIIKDDPLNHTRARTLRLVGTRAVRARVKEFRGHRVIVTGGIKVRRHEPTPDMLGVGGTRKVGDKVTIYGGGTAEQTQGRATHDPEQRYELDVADITSIAPKCRSVK